MVDTRRFRLAIASNIGSKPFTKTELEDLAYYLYNEREWSYSKVGAALSISRENARRKVGKASKHRNGSTGAISAKSEQDSATAQRRKQLEQRIEQLIEDKGRAPDQGQGQGQGQGCRSGAWHWVGSTAGSGVPGT